MQPGAEKSANDMPPATWVDLSIPCLCKGLRFIGRLESLCCRRVRIIYTPSHTLNVLISYGAIPKTSRWP